MASSFRRHAPGGGTGLGGAPAATKVPGTRPWVNGQTLTSTGNRDLDGVIGGGLCLGTVTVMEEDRFSDHAMTLARYFLAQGAAVGHRCLVVGAEGEDNLQDFVSTLPAKVQEKQSSQATTAPSESGLKIAWQYRKYISPPDGPTSGSASSLGAPLSASPSAAQYCFSFDLSNPSGQTATADLAIMDVGEYSRAGNYGAIYGALAGLIAGLPPGVVLRVVLKSFLSAGGWGHKTDNGRLSLHFLYSLRRLIHGTPVVVLLTIPAHHLPERQITLLSRVADTVLGVDSFSGKSEPPPPEFRDFVGFVYIKAVQHVNTLAPTRGASNKYGLKRDRRKLHIQPLHLPPEDARALTEDVEKAKKKQPGAADHGNKIPRAPMVARGGCGSASSKALDF